MNKVKKEKIREILLDWFYGIEPKRTDRYRYALGYKIKKKFLRNKWTCAIYTNYPGPMIGPQGKYIQSLEQEFSRNGFHMQIDLVELGNYGRFKEITYK